MNRRINLSERRLHSIIKGVLAEERYGRPRTDEANLKGAFLAGAVGLGGCMGPSNATHGGLDINDECPQAVVCKISTVRYGDIEIVRDYDEYFAEINGDSIPLGDIVSCGSGYNDTNKSLNFTDAKLEWVDGNNVVFTLGDGIEISGTASKGTVSESRLRSVVKRCVRG